MHKFLASVAMTLLLGGCATRADNIATSYVSPMQYESYSCS